MRLLSLLLLGLSTLQCPLQGHLPLQPPTSATSEPSSSSQEISSRPGADSENERPDYSSSEEEFDSKDALDDWVTSLCLYDRKMLALTLQKHFKLTATAAALESAWVTVCGYRKDFLANSGTSKKERRGKYKRLSLFNDENLRLEAGQGTCSSKR